MAQRLAATWRNERQTGLARHQASRENPGVFGQLVVLIGEWPTAAELSKKHVANKESSQRASGGRVKRASPSRM